MKTQNLIGAVMMVSLSFTACQKNDLLTPSPASLIQEERKAPPQNVGLPGSPQIPVADQLPAKVIDMTTGKNKLFTYDNASHLVGMQEENQNMAFAYDRLGRVARIEISPIYESTGAKRILVMNYIGNEIKPESIDEVAQAGTREELVKTIVVKYDHHLNKISEQEIGLQHKLLATRLFTYDAVGNCVEFRDVERGLIVKHLKFSDFDNHPSLIANVPALSLLPGMIFQKSNAQTVTDIAEVRGIEDANADASRLIASNNTGMALNNLVKGTTMSHFKFHYNNFNFPKDVMEIKSDIEQQVQAIEYIQVKW